MDLSARRKNAGGRSDRCDLTIGSPKHFHQFENFLSLLVLVTARYSVLNAMADMIAQNLLLDAPQGGAYGGKLGYYIDTVTIFFDHPRKSAHLTLDTT
jgi:hypothetical protein